MTAGKNQIELAHEIVHEISTPLTLIALNCDQILAQTRSEKDAKKIELAAECIRETVMRISHILRRVKNEHRTSDDPFVATKISKLINDALTLCRARLPEEAFDLQIFGNQEAVVECRPVQLSQVLLNLLTNARDAIRGLSEKWIRLEILENADHVTIAVCDNGQGVPFEIREKIMQPFFTTKSFEGGSGLGLSISNEIVAAHNGLLFLDHSSAHTRFVAELPKFQHIPLPSPAYDAVG